MITLLEIQKAISRKLNSRFNTHYIYTEEVKQGLKRPSFFISILPIFTSNFVAYKGKLIGVDIMYFSKNETNEEILNMVNALEGLLKTLVMEDREITIETLNFKTVDNILHCNFSLDFNDINEEISDINLGYTEEDTTFMQELESEVN